MMIMMMLMILTMVMILKIQVTLKLKKNIAQIGRLIAKHDDEDFDKFISEEVSKIILHYQHHHQY